MIDLLEEDGSNWAIHFKKALLAFESGDYQRCSQIILSGSGGMGSLNDLILGQTQDQYGAFQWKSDHKETNQRFQYLLDSLYGFSHGLKKAANKFKNENASKLARTPHKTRRPF